MRRALNFPSLSGRFRMAAVVSLCALAYAASATVHASGFAAVYVGALVLGNAELRAFHAEKGIVTEAWSPLGQGGGELEDPVVTAVAEAHGASPAQVLLAWNLALGNVVVSKSVTPERIAANLASLELTLTDDEIAKIAALDKGAAGRQGPDPDTFAGHQGA